jgi:4'-phosphopantetheinyl transferase EntD
MDSIFQYEVLTRGETKIHSVTYPAFDPQRMLHVLTPEELHRFQTFGHIKRQREFIATRALRHHLFGLETIHYSKEGAPYVKKDVHISISHSKNTVAIALNQSFLVGLDLEAVRNNIHDLMHRFLSYEEKEAFDCSDPRIITSIWSAKEALYKLAGRKKLIFAKELLISNTKPNWTGRIVNPDHELLVKLDIFEKNDIIYSLNKTALERIQRDTK